MKEEIDRVLDNFILDIQNIFHQMMVADLTHVLGQRTLNDISDYAVVSQQVGFDLELEPIPLTEIKKFDAEYPHFVYEVFHNRMVQKWNNLIDNIFIELLGLHFSGKRKFDEFGKKRIEMDFASDEEMFEQIKQGAIKNFRFEEYSKRLNLINKVLGRTHVEGRLSTRSALINVHKNVLIRNAIQHNNIIFNVSYILKELGVKEIIVLDSKGETINIAEDNRIVLTVPELFSLKQSMLIICQSWR